MASEFDFPILVLLNSGNCFNPSGAKRHICRLSVECQSLSGKVQNICRLISFLRYQHALSLKGNYNKIIYVHFRVNILYQYY